VTGFLVTINANFWAAGKNETGGPLLLMGIGLLAMLSWLLFPRSPKDV